jgi:hypothetical protein
MDAQSNTWMKFIDLTLGPKMGDNFLPTILQ